MVWSMPSLALRCWQFTSENLGFVYSSRFLDGDVFTTATSDTSARLLMIAALTYPGYAP